MISDINLYTLMYVYNHTCTIKHACTHMNPQHTENEKESKKHHRLVSGLTFLLHVKIALHGPLAGWSVILVGRFHPLHQSLYLLSSTFKVIPCLKGRKRPNALSIFHHICGTSQLKSQNCKTVRVTLILLVLFNIKGLCCVELWVCFESIYWKHSKRTVYLFL